MQPDKVKLGLRLAQSRPLYEAFAAMRASPGWAALPEARKRIVEGELRDATLAGVALEGAQKERFNEIQQAGDRSRLSPLPLPPQAESPRPATHKPLHFRRESYLQGFLSYGYG